MSLRRCVAGGRKVAGSRMGGQGRGGDVGGAESLERWRLCHDLPFLASRSGSCDALPGAAARGLSPVGPAADVGPSSPRQGAGGAAPSRSEDEGAGEPSPGADVGEDVSSVRRRDLVVAQMWQGRVKSWRRCGRERVPSQRRVETGVSPVVAQMREEESSPGADVGREVSGLSCNISDRGAGVRAVNGPSPTRR